ncbi:helix-turn-helix domain-containing protein [Mycobacteroides abscessus]|uniref:helix-turn-helix domain-containing protein n=1 Tax=Mycobacteroides abscessus TaxID=36809 RepID=UPI000927ED10|nr:helix-turn-helix domain-containing protein [Mycobacteroides abscessus]SHP47954.1 transcriptional regulator [Mycobacteroides abscessus subsp. abscessus]SHP49977.1 transcriptional regulator [Mycobacteroides abscessus subsp. abscessus]SHP68740.1 transcriptional regulator [Mycobacteroides abscessus subsp. abscessus]SHQ24912.1 transcriptional regulator [Mycobacteroides abscessus subsp. abscessus]SHR11793.1 transcriptional regulator [Mycobacteroides abscessus subsp. abscessus]
MKNTGAERAEERAVLKVRYEAGASIRTIAAANGHSYGYVHDALVATGTQLRGRGGPNNQAGCRRRRNEPQSSPALD